MSIHIQNGSYDISDYGKDLLMHLTSEMNVLKVSDDNIIASSR